MPKNNQKKENINKTTRLLLLVTHACCLRCKYCFVQQDSKEHMSEETFLKSVDFLMSSSSPHVQLQFFGGEPLFAPFPLIKKAITYAKRKAAEKNKLLDIIITTNGVMINKRMIGFFKKNNVVIELSLDGDEKSQNINRPQRKGFPSFYSLIVKNLPLIFKEKVDCRASMVVTPETADRLVGNFKHLIDLGFEKIFIMTACGVFWPKSKLSSLKKNLNELGSAYIELTKKKKNINFLNLKEWMPPFRMNTELSVDFDGNIYSACISYLIHDRKKKKQFNLGNINKVKRSIDFYETRRLSNPGAMQAIFEENKILDNLPSNIKAGETMSDFVKSLRQKYHEKAG